MADNSGNPPMQDRLADPLGQVGQGRSAALNQREALSSHSMLSQASAIALHFISPQTSNVAHVAEVVNTYATVVLT